MIDQIISTIRNANRSSEPPGVAESPASHINLYKHFGLDSCIVIRANGTNHELGISDGDYLLAINDITPRSGDLVVTSSGGKLSIRKFQPTLKLVVSSTQWSIDQNPLMVVTHVVKNRRNL